LNSMADRDFDRALDQHVAWELELLDLKDCVYGKSIAELNRDEAGRAAEAITRRKLSVYCFSTPLFSGEMDVGEKECRRRLFDRLGLRHKFSFTWDVANLWQMGTFPTLEVYAQIKHLIGYVHVKGGLKGDRESAFGWASSLEDASWPVAEIVKAVISDGVSPV